ncbi:hypothetical protein [Kingella kingae]|nr:hypothetical protein [Kingella kingae]
MNKRTGARQITLEMDLHKVGLQEPFIRQVGETLSRLGCNSSFNDG